MHRFLGLLLIFFCTFSCFAQQKKPKLVVGVVVDQMRQEYLNRFNAHFGTDGFNRILHGGYNFKNTHINYQPTETAPGHASIYTGTTPTYHGILGNNWFDQSKNKRVYCVGDPNHKTVGSDTDEGEMSPHRLLTTTITDELRQHTLGKAKIIGLSLKDRAAVLPAGRTGEAYWYDNDNGKFVTSTYYRDKLPKWVTKFNNEKWTDQYLNKEWNPVKDLSTYVETGPDQSDYEDVEVSTFPHLIKTHDDIYGSPFGNEALFELTKRAIVAENLGGDDITDFLAISFSSTDVVGHDYGPYSKEVQDVYLRMDMILADLLNYLDEKVGKGEYLLFLTADHGVADNVHRLNDQSIPAGLYDEDDIEVYLDSLLQQEYEREEILENVYTNNVFLDEGFVELHPEVISFVALALKNYEGIANVFTSNELKYCDYNAGGIMGMVKRGYNQANSGQIIINFESGWQEHWYDKGVGHGSPYTYDSHIPLLFYGNGIKEGSSLRYVGVHQIAPTLAHLLGIPLPSGATGEPLDELFE